MASVRLAKRYVQDRALPDAAIDLLDETAARKRVEIDGVPANVDAAIRRLASLKAQTASLAGDVGRDEREDARAPRERDSRARAHRRARCAFEARFAPRRRGRARGACAAKRRACSRSSRGARTRQDFARLGELEHVQLPDVKRRLDAAEAAVGREVGAGTSNVVTEEDVALVLGDWTGIPVEQDARSRERKASQDGGSGSPSASSGRTRRCGRSRAQCVADASGCAIRASPSDRFLFLGPSGVGKTELAKALAEFLFDDEQSR